MAARETFPYRTSTLVEVLHPTAVATKNPLDNTNEGSTCEARLYDPAKSENLSADAALGASVLSVTNSAVFVIGNIVELTQDDDTVHESTVTDTDPSAGTVTIADVTTVAASSGNRFRVRIGDIIPMLEFGTATFGTLNWGFGGTISSTHAVQVLGQEFDLEFQFVGSVAGGLDWLGTICGIIKNVEDCT